MGSRHRSHGHRRRLWAQDLQVVADVVEAPSHSTLSKNQGWSSHFWEVWWLGQLELLGDDWVFSEGWTHVSCLTPKEG